MAAADPDRTVVVASDSVAAARLLAVLPGGTCAEVLLLDRDAADEAAAALPARRVVILDGVLPTDPLDVLAPGLAPWLPERGLVVLDDGQPSRDLAGWVVAARGAALAWGVDSVLAGDGWVTRRTVIGGNARVEQTFAGDGLLVVLAKPAGDTARIPGTVPAIVERATVTLGAGAVRVLRSAPSPAASVLLTAARVVVAVGRGVGGAERIDLFRRLADRLGGALGASRVAVDAGWLPFAHQVGQTGTAVAPDVYLAFGISGAIQHLAGMRSSRSVVAVNTDPTAPLCRRADVVVPQDAVEFATALLERLEAEPPAGGSPPPRTLLTEGRS